MAEMLLLDSLKELRTVIDQQHLLYLELDENPKKIDQREKLESYIKEYLYLAPHDSKFTFQQTAEVLHQSARIKNNFSAYKAALAWRAIGKYADNLISHPWRKEYRDIKLYCGFFKHEIEESLFGAELMFEAMGYRHVGGSSMVLHGILDPDRITSVSKDAIVAFVECQIMKQIWETLSTHFNISWLEILEFRENHAGTPEQVIRALTYKYRLKHYQEQLYHKPQAMRNAECHLPHAECYYAHHPGYYSHVPYPGPSYSFPPQNRYGPVNGVQHLLPASPIYPPNIPTSYLPPNVLKPQDVYPMNGYLMPHYSSQFSMPHVTPNGYPGMSMMCTAPSVVPTGQLIELESSPTHTKGEVGYQKFLSSSKYASQEDAGYHPDTLKDNEPSLTGKAKDDGAGSWETWDFVYRNLESQGYIKNSDSKGRMQIKGNRSSSSQNNSSDDIDSIIQTDFSDKMRKMKLDSSNCQSRNDTSSSKSYPDTDEGVRVKNTKENNKSELEKVKEPVRVKVEHKSLMTSPEKTKKSNNTTANRSITPKQKGNDQLKETSNLKKSKEGAKPLIVNLDDAEEKWQCVTCTYLNSISNNVCEMCYKSKDRGSELNPQPSGGQECPKCTLVNEPGLSSCAVCNASLKGSPTYI